MGYVNEDNGVKKKLNQFHSKYFERQFVLYFLQSTILIQKYTKILNVCEVYINCTR